MKLCPECGTICPDSEMVCGACRADISDVPIESMDQIELELADEKKREKAVEQKEFEKAKVRLVVRDVVVVLVAAAVVLAGFFLVFAQTNWYGFFLILLGFAIIFAMLGMPIPWFRMRRGR